MRRSEGDPRSATPIRTGDVVLAAVLLVGMWAEVLLTTEGAVGFRLFETGVAAAAVAVRWKWPLMAAMVAALVHAWFIYYAHVEGLDRTTALAHDLAGVFLVYGASRWPTLWRSGVGVLSILLAVGAAQTVSGGVDGAIATTPFIAVAMAAVAMRYRHALIDEQHHLARIHEREALEEELRASISSHMESVADHARAGSAARSDDERLLELMKIEDAANISVDEMRRIVGILRRPEVAT